MTSLSKKPSSSFRLITHVIQTLENFIDAFLHKQESFTSDYSTGIGSVANKTGLKFKPV